MKRAIKSPEERFWQKVNKTDGCWVWTASVKGRGYKNGGGYGHFTIYDGERIRYVGAHRFSYELHFGPIPEGLVVCHKCDNRQCVRPDHLFVGTQQDNITDCIQKGRNNTGAKNGRNKHPERYEAAVAATRKLSPEVVRELRKNPPKDLRAVAKKLGVSPNAIYQAIKRITYRHIA